jgi:hypothetical protein
MKYSFLILCSALCITTLSGCEAQMFGVPKSQFYSLNPAQQQQVIDAYNQRQMIKTQNEPLTNLIDVASQAVNQRGRD